MNDFEKKVGIVTGGTKGIGKFMVKHLIARGAKVYVLARDAEVGKQIEQELGPRCVFRQADVTDGDQVQSVVDAIVEAEKHLDFLVNNAGVTKDNLLVRMRDDEWDLVFATNLKGAFYCTKAVARTMMKQRSGAILNVTSIVGITGNAGQANYASAKAGLIGFTKSIARELASRHVRVNAIAPGFFETQLTIGLPDALKQKYLENIPLGRFGTGDEIAEVACFLLSDRASYITGQVLNVDGGMVML
jgi:3-oxoacyl-[acyl-carrier protein] reductase